VAGQLSTSAAPPNEQARFRLEFVDSDGTVVTRKWINEPHEAMRAFVQLVRARRTTQHRAGSHVALTDLQLQLSAAWISEGNGTYATKFAQPAGRSLYAQIAEELDASCPALAAGL
jgi:hypothetical protein